MSKYQLLPPLSPDEYASLFDDIASGGVKVPIDVDEAGEILDGHHRKRVCDELGIECPTRVVEIPEAAKADYALTVNLARRHLDRMQRRQLVVNSLKLDYRLGDRVHARRCGVDHKTVTSIRADLVAVGEIPHLTEREGADGKTYPASKPTPPSAPAATPGRAEAPEIPPDDESGEDRPATGTLGEAESDSALSAADVSAPSAPQTGGGSSPDESKPVDGQPQAGLGVTQPAAVPEPPASPLMQWAQGSTEHKAAALRKELHGFMAAGWALMNTVGPDEIAPFLKPQVIEDVDSFRRAFNTWVDATIANHQKYTRPRLVKEA